MKQLEGDIPFLFIFYIYFDILFEIFENTPLIGVYIYL